MIKKYLQFIKDNKQTLPDTFYHLKSANLLLDVENGRIYNATKDDYKDGFDLPFKEYYDTFINTLSKEDKVVIDKYYISCESIVKPKLDMDLIEDIFDLSVSEELFDHYYFLNINVNLKDNPNLPVFSFYGDSKEKKYNYDKLFKNQLDKIEKSNESDYNYQVVINIDGLTEEKAVKSIRRIKDIILDMYPELDIEFDF